MIYEYTHHHRHHVDNNRWQARNAFHRRGLMEWGGNEPASAGADQVELICANEENSSSGTFCTTLRCHIMHTRFVFIVFENWRTARGASKVDQISLHRCPCPSWIFFSLSFKLLIGCWFPNWAIAHGFRLTMQIPEDSGAERRVSHSVKWHFFPLPLKEKHSSRHLLFTTRSAFRHEKKRNPFVGACKRDYYTFDAWRWGWSEKGRRKMKLTTSSRWWIEFFVLWIYKWEQLGRTSPPALSFFSASVEPFSPFLSPSHLINQ